MSDGSTAREHWLRAASRRSPATRAKAEAALHPPPLPACVRHQWAWFQELHPRRGAGAMGPAPITWVDLDAWARMTGRNPTRWDLDALAALDGVYFASVIEPKPVPSARKRKGTAD